MPLYLFRFLLLSYRVNLTYPSIRCQYDEMKKNIIIFCRHFDPAKSPFNSDYYWNAYIDLLLAIKAAGAEAYFATDMNTYKGDGLFSVAYTSDVKVPLPEFRSESNIHADLVYDKGGFTARDVPVLNPDFVANIARDKIETYKQFASYQPFSIVCNNDTEYTDALKDIPSDLAVVKKPQSNGGHGVFIQPKEELTNSPLPFPVLVQEFLDTSVGVAGFVAGAHDVRVIIGGGEILGGKLREPRPGEYRANVAQGSTEDYLFLEQIPDEAKRIALEIDRSFQDYPRYYAIDLANTPKGWKVIELNNKPGLSPVTLDAGAKHITEKLAQYLTRLV